MSSPIPISHPTLDRGGRQAVGSAAHRVLRVQETAAWFQQRTRPQALHSQKDKVGGVTHSTSCSPGTGTGLSLPGDTPRRGVPAATVTMVTPSRTGEVRPPVRTPSQRLASSRRSWRRRLLPNPSPARPEKRSPPPRWRDTARVFKKRHENPSPITLKHAHTQKEAVLKTHYKAEVNI